MAAQPVPGTTMNELDVSGSFVFSLRYTLCFLTRGDQVLLLHRRNPPNQGLWNGVGGRLELGETPLAACLREVREETGFVLPTARFAGLLTWEGFETAPGGLYLFAAEAPPGEPGPCAEGELAWRPAAWMVSAAEVVSNLHVVGGPVLNGAPPRVYHFVYAGNAIQRHGAHPLPGWMDPATGAYAARAAG